MSSTSPSPANSYTIPPGQYGTRAFFQAVFTSVHDRLAALELTEADYQGAIDAITTQALAIVSATISEEIVDQRAVLAQTRTAVEALLSEYEAVEAAGLPAAQARLAPIAGFAPANLQTAIEALVAREPLSLLPPIVTAPAPNSTPTLNAGALVLSVDRLYSLYPKVQKTLRFQIGTDAGFATVVHDTGAVATAGLTISVPNAASILTGGAAYWTRAIQTDQDDASSGWSATAPFTFPRLPAAPIMSAPANGATGQGAQNAAITLTASAYSHPNGVAQASRRFEISRDNFASIITIAGTVGAASATIANPKDVLTANTTYAVRAVDTDVNGGVAAGGSTSFKTATAFLPNIGDPYGGGFFMGQYTDPDDGLTYNAIRAPKSSGFFSSLAWSPSSGDPGVFDPNYGPENSALLAGTSYPAGRACETLTAGGVSDWYLPPGRECQFHLQALYAAGISNPAFANGGAEYTSPSAYHWSSTRIDNNNAMACYATSDTDSQFLARSKTSGLAVFAVRRIQAD